MRIINEYLHHQDETQIHALTALSSVTADEQGDKLFKLD